MIIYPSFARGLAQRFSWDGGVDAILSFQRELARASVEIFRILGSWKVCACRRGYV